MLSHLERLFPNLRGTGFRETSPMSRDYNCIAWAAGETDRWWWPVASPFAYWPAGVMRENRVESFIEAFRVLGYEPCDDDKLEKGSEKVAVYLDSNGKPTHMARQLSSGEWTSKLGELQDIVHPSLFALENSSHGRAVQILRRPSHRTRRSKK
jgi:hypothetical protein